MKAKVTSSQKTPTEKVKVSVVVPIYGVEKYLRQCLDSIIQQTLSEIEIILVDDGSPDQCPAIIDEYTQHDPRIIAIHQKNAGYGAAVNHGLSRAHGEYISIIESDDWVEPEMLMELYQAAQLDHADIVKGMFWKTNSTLPKPQQNVVFADPSGVDLRLAPTEAFQITEWPTLLAFHASLWSAIYRREFLHAVAPDSKLFTETAGAAYQDFPFIMQVLCAAKKIKIVKKPFVHWRNDPDQVHSTNATNQKALQMVASCQTGIEIVKQSGHYDQLEEALYIHALWTNVGFFYNINRKYQKEYWQALRRLLLPIKQDPTFTYQYFRPYDKLFFRIITSKSWSVVKLGLLAMSGRRKIRKFLQQA